MKVRYHSLAREEVIEATGYYAHPPDTGRGIPS
jgi:hypothetical protein